MKYYIRPQTINNNTSFIMLATKLEAEMLKKYLELL